jgi:hypothetical protein
MKLASKATSWAFALTCCVLHPQNSYWEVKDSPFPCDVGLLYSKMWPLNNHLLRSKALCELMTLPFLTLGTITHTTPSTVTDSKTQSWLWWQCRICSLAHQNKVKMTYNKDTIYQQLHGSLWRKKRVSWECSMAIGRAEAKENFREQSDITSIS